jgi:hypothetical protein
MKEFNLDGIDLSSEGAAAEIMSRHNDNVSGLKLKNTDLIDREKAAKLTTDEMAIRLATQEEEQKVLLAEKDGTVAEYKASLVVRDEKIEAIQLEIKQADENRLIESAVNDFGLLVVTDDKMGRKGMIDTFRDGISVSEGKITSKDGSKSLEELTQSLVSDKANAKYIKAVVGSGVGSAGSKGGFNSVKLPKDMNGAERMEFKQNDPAGFKQAFNLT